MHVQSCGGSRLLSRFPFAVLAVGLACSGATASDLLTPRLLVDSNPGPSSGFTTTFSAFAGTSVGAPFVRIGDVVYFQATTQNLRTIWRTDGRPGSAQSVLSGVTTHAKAIPDSPLSAAVALGGSPLGLYGFSESSPAVLLVAGASTPATLYQWSDGQIPTIRNAALVVGRDAQQRPQVFATDGTVQGTRQITSFTSNVQILDIAAGTNRAFILALGLGGHAVISTDGTPAGTINLITHGPRPTWSSTTPPLQMVGDSVVYAVPASGSLQVWSSDGTPAGTLQSFSIPGSPNGNVWLQRDTTGIYYERTNALRKEIWHIGASSEHSRLLIDFPSNTQIRALAAHNGMTLFSDAQGTYMTRPTLWVTDGTVQNTFGIPRLMVADRSQTGSGGGALAGGEFWFSGSLSPSNGTQMPTDLDPVRINLNTGSLQLFDVLGTSTFSGPFGFVALGHNRGTAFASPLAGQSGGMYVMAPDAALPTRVSLANATTAAATGAIGNRILIWSSQSPFGTEPAVIDLCPPDFDNDGQVSIVDVMSYIDAWMTKSPTADTDGPGTPPDSADLFNFLNSWFSGC